MKKLILIIFLLLAINLAKADNETYHDFRLETNIDDKINANTEIDKFFKVTYLNHTTGEKEQVFVEVYYNVTRNNTLLKEDVFNVTVNSYTTSKTGYYFFNQTGNYTICGEIILTALDESNFENNKACKNFSVISTEHIPCNISLTIETEKLIYENKEKISFKNLLNNDSFNYEIEYWVEDLFGNIFKKPYTTSNLNKKSYTPKIENKVEVLKIIANISYLACNDSNKSDNYYETLIIVKGEEKEEVECPECICEEPEKKTTKKTELEFADLPKEITTGKDFKIKVLIKNNDDEKHEFDVYSYIYRGSKCYSESRDNNKRTVKINAFDSEIVELEDNVKEAEDGEYNIKVKLKQDNLKTEKEIKEEIEIKNIEIVEEREEKIIEKLDSEINIKPIEIQECVSKQVEDISLEKVNLDYESSSEKSKKLINYFILTTLSLVVIIFVLKNGQK